MLYTNTDFSNSNSNIAFQAKLVSELKIPAKYAQKFKSVAKAFAEKTKDSPYDKVTVGHSLDQSFAEYPSVRLNDDVQVGDYKYSHLMENFGEMLEKWSEKDIVKRFVKYFKLMKIEKYYCHSDRYLGNYVDEQRQLFSFNKNMAESYKRRNMDLYASRYEYIASRCKSKLDELETEKNKCLSDIIKKMEKIVKGDKDLEHVPQIYREVDNIPQ